MMVADRIDLTACLNAQRMVVEALQAAQHEELEHLVRIAKTKDSFALLLVLARRASAEKLEARLDDISYTQSCGERS